MFTFVCSASDGRTVHLGYDPHTSRLTNADGSPVIEVHAVPADDRLVPFHRVAHDEPGRKSRSPEVLKIQLGLNCNYGCSYCSQASQVDSATITRTSDVHAFLRDLDGWLIEPPRKIEFWGGEPFLFFAKLKLLVPELDRRFPNAGFSIVSNGSLIDEEIAEFILDYDIELAISHDGPGQPHRGADPFDDETRLRWIQHLWSALKPRGRMSFNAVLTPGNGDPARIRRWFAERLGDPDVVINLEGVVATYDEKVRDGVGSWTPAQYSEMREAIAHAFETGEALRVPTLRAKAQSFVMSLEARTSSDSLGQKCGMDREDHIAVDLQSNVLTCQNTGGNGRHNIGSAREMDDVSLDTATHWSHREDCARCPVLHLCGGSCMFLDGADFAQSCENEYHYNLGVIDGVLRRSLGIRLLDVHGPKRSAGARARSIPIYAR